MFTWLSVIVAMMVSTGLMYLERRRRDARLASGELEVGRVLPPVAGHRQTAAWSFVRSGPGGRSDVDWWCYECRVYGLLPSWATLFIVGGDLEESGASGVLGRALFGEAQLSACPEDWIVSAEGPDLVVQSAEEMRSAASRRRPTQVEDYTQGLARAAAAMDEDALAAALAEQVTKHDRAEALMLLGRHLRHSRGTEALIARMVHDGPPEVRLAAARLDAPGATAALSSLARNDQQPTHRRERAVLALATLGAKDVLRTLAAQASGAIDRTLLEVLKSDRGPEVARLAIRMLDSDDPILVTEASDVLATVGGREAVAPLRRRLERGGPHALKEGLRVTLEVVQSRLTGAAGGLALLEEPDDDVAGRLSLANRADGALSPTDADLGTLSTPRGEPGA